MFPLDSQEFAKLDKLRSKVSDLCDLQPTPVSMARPARKEMLKELRGELVAALGDVESQLEELGGSASTVSARTHTTAQSRARSTKSSKAPSIAEES